MLEVALLPLSPTVEPAVLALNNAHAAELSWLDRDRLTSLLRQAFHARRIGEVDGFLLAFDQSAAYDSPNYLWFRQRYRRFVYVDRVVVAHGARGRGYAGMLYADLFNRAGRAEHVTQCGFEVPNLGRGTHLDQETLPNAVRRSACVPDSPPTLAA